MSSDSNQSSSTTDQQQFMQVVDDRATGDGTKLAAAGKVASEQAHQVQHGLDSKHLATAAEVVAQVMGGGVRPFVAQLSKSYEGPIVHIKEGLAFQKTSPQSVVVHKVGDLISDEHALKTVAEAAQHKHAVSIEYNEKGGAQLEIKTRDKERQVSHAKDRGVEMGD